MRVCVNIEGVNEWLAGFGWVRNWVYVLTLASENACWCENVCWWENSFKCVRCFLIIIFLVIMIADSTISILKKQRTSIIEGLPIMCCWWWRSGFHHHSIKRSHNYSFDTISKLSLLSQLISVWSGFSSKVLPSCWSCCKWTQNSWLILKVTVEFNSFMKVSLYPVMWN